MNVALAERLHDKAIAAGGGASGVRDAGLLQSALDRPKNQYAYGEEDLFRLAATYAEGIAQNHAFVDGNKRTALTSAIAFLALNGHDLRAAAGAEHADVMVALSTGEKGLDDVADHFRQYSDPIT